MAKKPFDPSEYEQRTLEGPEDGPLRAALRRIVKRSEQWTWLRAGIWKALAWATVFATLLATFRDNIIAFFKGG